MISLLLILEIGQTTRAFVHLEIPKKSDFKIVRNECCLADIQINATKNYYSPLLPLAHGVSMGLLLKVT